MEKAKKKRAVLLDAVADFSPRLVGTWHRQNAFRAVYKTGEWGTEKGSRFFSGIGSRGQTADAYVSEIAARISILRNELGRTVRVVDLGCGDFAVGGELLHRVKDIFYVGCDIVPELILHHKMRVRDPRATFRAMDIVTDSLPDGDLCLVRQVFQHLSNNDINRVLSKLQQYQRVYITEGQPLVMEGGINPDKPVGGDVRFDWRTGRGRGVELNKPPFGLDVQEVLSVLSTPFERIVTYELIPFRSLTDTTVDRLSSAAESKQSRLRSDGRGEE